MRKLFFMILLMVIFTFSTGFSNSNDVPAAEKQVYKNTQVYQYTGQDFQQLLDKLFGGSNYNVEKKEKQEPAKPAEDKEEKENAEKANVEKETPEKEAQKENAEKEAPENANVEKEETKVQENEQQEEQQTNSTLNAFEQEVVELTNAERAKHGLSALQIDEALSKVAREKSRDMAANGYFSHQSPTYGSPFDMMKQYGVDYRTAGENIAKGQTTPEQVVNGWMNSEGHRANILNGNYTHIGVGYVEQGNHWTQQFIGK